MLSVLEERGVRGLVQPQVVILLLTVVQLPLLVVESRLRLQVLQEGVVIQAQV